MCVDAKKNAASPVNTAGPYAIVQSLSLSIAQSRRWAEPGLDFRRGLTDWASHSWAERRSPTAHRRLTDTFVRAQTHRMRIPGGLAVGVVLASFALGHLDAVTNVPSSDGQFWDIQDTSPWAQDSGGIATGGRANPFNGFGYLKLQVRASERDAARATTSTCSGFGLHHDGARTLRFDHAAAGRRHPRVARHHDRRRPIYLRYFDSFTNVADEDRVVEVAWGGAAGAYDDGGQVAVATTSSGDRRIDPADALRDGDAERATRRGPDARAVRPWTVGARARHRSAGVLTRRRRHVRRSVRRHVARVRSGAHRLRLHAPAAARARRAR